MAETKVMSCNCKHEFQDNQYGKNMRVFNPIGKTQNDGYRCTICGREVGNGSSKKK
jgi:hypothetical protein